MICGVYDLNVCFGLLYSQLVAVRSKRLLVDLLLLIFQNVILTPWTVSGPSELLTDKELFLGSYF